MEELEKKLSALPKGKLSKKADFKIRTKFAFFMFRKKLGRLLSFHTHPLSKAFYLATFLLVFAGAASYYAFSSYSARRYIPFLKETPQDAPEMEPLSPEEPSDKEIAPPKETAADLDVVPSPTTLIEGKDDFEIAKKSEDDNSEEEKEDDRKNDEKDRDDEDEDNESDNDEDGGRDDSDERDGDDGDDDERSARDFPRDDFDLEEDSDDDDSDRDRRESSSQERSESSDREYDKDDKED